MSTERPTPSPTGPPVGQIGNYDVLQKIATGGMGEVFLARQRGPSAFSRYVVLKRLHPQFMSDAVFVDMFLNEAQIAANLSHANIAHIYELFEDGNNGYVIAMEYVRGGTVLAMLRERARKQKAGLPFGTVARITNAICEALHYAYFEPGPDGAPRNVIHRDVSPSNVIVGYDGQIKLVDFGIAKALHAEATHATSLKGKYGYMSPEQIKSQPLDHRTDIFSLGTMMWEMFVGKRLFKRDTDMQMLYAILEEGVPKPSERSTEIPPAVDHIVMRALSRAREERYQDALEISQDLRAVASNNDWDTEPSTLGRLVKELIPMDMTAIATGEKPGSDSGKPIPRTSRPSMRTEAAAWQPSAGTDVEEPQIEITHPKNEQPVDPSNNTMVIAILVLVLFSSLVFWLGIAPNL
ncbi:MAG TPA: serine/threonine-protein kinase [Kofleriaceae bacterium]